MIALVGAVIAALTLRKVHHPEPAPGGAAGAPPVWWRRNGVSAHPQTGPVAPPGRGSRPRNAGRPCSTRPAGSSSGRATAAPRRPRSPARRGSPSRSSTGTSARSATSTSRASTRPGGSFREFAEEAVEKNPAGCLGAIADAYMAKRSKLRLVDLWIQALTEASEDAVIAKAVREQIREVHDFFAEVIRHGPGGRRRQRRPRSRSPRRGSSSPAACSPRSTIASAASSAATSSACAPRAAPGCSQTPDARRRRAGRVARPPGGPGYQQQPPLPQRSRSRTRFSSIPPFIDGRRCRTVGDRLTNVNEDALRPPADLLCERRAADACRRGC